MEVTYKLGIYRLTIHRGKKPHRRYSASTLLVRLVVARYAIVLSVVDKSTEQVLGMSARENIVVG
jgi:hypothetical protein